MLQGLAIHVQTRPGAESSQRISRLYFVLLSASSTVASTTAMSSLNASIKPHVMRYQYPPMFLNICIRTLSLPSSDIVSFPSFCCVSSPGTVAHSLLDLSRPPLACCPGRQPSYYSSSSSFPRLPPCWTSLVLYETTLCFQCNNRSRSSNTTIAQRY